MEEIQVASPRVGNLLTVAYAGRNPHISVFLHGQDGQPSFCASFDLKVLSQFFDDLADPKKCEGNADALAGRGDLWAHAKDEILSFHERETEEEKGATVEGKDYHTFVSHLRDQIGYLRCKGFLK